jgi:TolA-binding protein
VPAGKALGTGGIIAAGAVVLALVVGGGVMLSSGESTVDAPSVNAPAPGEVVPPAKPAEPAPTPAVAPEPRAPEQAVEPESVQPRAQRGHVSPPAAANAASLREEIRLIDSARIAVKKNDSTRAISILDQYARRFPNGTFREEARVLRAEARKLH